MYNNIETGKTGEDIATRYLINQGYYIHDRNFRCKLGEIDIIAIDKIDKNELVFIEVKTRNQNIFGNPAEAIDYRKINHIYKVAEYYLMINNLEHAFVRLDVIEVYEKSNNKIQINHIKNAIVERPEKNVTFVKSSNKNRKE